MLQHIQLMPANSRGFGIMLGICWAVLEMCHHGLRRNQSPNEL